MRILKGYCAYIFKLNRYLNHHLGNVTSYK